MGKAGDWQEGSGKEENLIFLKVYLIIFTACHPRLSFQNLLTNGVQQIILDIDCLFLTKIDLFTIFIPLCVKERDTHRWRETHRDLQTEKESHVWVILAISRGLIP